MLALMLALAAAPPSPFECADTIEVIGWSADESKVALRLYYGSEAFELEKCPGYVGAGGKPFGGGLALVVLENGKLSKTFVIQRPRAEDEEQRCTPVAAARDALAKAKQAMEELGIARDAAESPKPALVFAHGKEKVTHQKRDGMPVTQTAWQDTWSSAEMAFQLTARDVCDDDMGLCQRFLSGTLQGPGPAPRKVLAQRALPKEEWDHNAAGQISMRFKVLSSPSQKVLLPLLYLDHFRMEGSWSTSLFLGPVAGSPPLAPAPAPAPQ